MHFHQKSANQFSNSLKALLLILITYSSTCDAALTPEDISEAMAVVKLDLQSTGKFCGRKLNEAMKVYCLPTIKDAILRGESGAIAKKSSELG